MQTQIKIVSVNISEEKGTVKQACSSIVLDATGVKHDAHAGDWHRQVSMLGIESVQRFEALSGRKIIFGEFAENITTEGLELYETKPGDRFYNEHIELEVTQIGKSCHGTSCSIFREVGACVMPKEGIFCKVLRGGILRPGDTLAYAPKNS
jgi:MOSC domain-containing protein YiiM